MESAGFWIETDGPLEAVVERFCAAMKEAGFGTLVDLDVRAILKEKIGADIEGYRLLGVCNPTLAHEATRKVPDIGILLPCGAVIRELADGRVRVGVVDPFKMAMMMDGPEREVVAAEMAKAASLLEGALRTLA